MSQLTEDEIKAISREFSSETGRFSGVAGRRPFAIIDALYRVLYPASPEEASGVDAVLSMIPSGERRERVRKSVQAFLALPERNRGNRQWGPHRVVIRYLSTILFGSVRPAGRAFALFGSPWRLQLLGIQSQPYWEALGREKIDTVFVKENGDPVVEEMRWSVVLPSFEFLLLEHNEGAALFRRFGIRLDDGVSVRTTTALIAGMLQKFGQQSERLPYTTFLGGVSVDDIARIYCQMEVGFVPDEPVQRLQLISTDLVEQSFPVDLPWGPRPSWLPWEHAWPTPHWRQKLPYTPNRFESDTYNNAAQRAYEQGGSVALIRVTETTLDGIIDYCRGVLETLLDDATQRTVMPGLRLRQPRRALHLLFLLKALDETDHMRTAYQGAREYLLGRELISKSTTIARSVYEPLGELVVDRVFRGKPPSDATMTWAKAHTLDILVIFSDMNKERVDLTREVAAWKAEEGSGARTPIEALVALARDEVLMGRQQLRYAIAIALREYGYEIGIHELSFGPMIVDGEGIRRVLAADSDGGTLSTMICSHCSISEASWTCKGCGAAYCGFACQEKDWHEKAHADTCAKTQV